MCMYVCMYVVERCLIQAPGYSNGKSCFLGLWSSIILPLTVATHLLLIVVFPESIT